MTHSSFRSKITVSRKRESIVWCGTNIILISEVIGKPLHLVDYGVVAIYRKGGDTLTSKEIALLTHARFDALLKERGITAYKVSRDNNFSQGMLSDWKAGRSSPKADKVKRLAEYFGVDIAYFYQDLE